MHAREITEHSGISSLCVIDLVVGYNVHAGLHILFIHVFFKGDYVDRTHFL